MAAQVQQQLEGMVPELRKLTELQIFTDEEVRDIVERRRKFEYAVISSDLVYSRNSYREYISYEIELDRVLQKRLRKVKSSDNSASVRYTVPSDRGNVPIKVIVRRRIHRLFNRCLKRFVTNIELWKEYCAFCYRIKAFGVMNRAIMDALSKNPTCEALWKIAVKYTLTLNGSIAARNVIQLALRANPRSLSLFMLLLELEVQAGYKIHELSESPTDDNYEEPVELSTKTWVTILRHSLKTLKDGDVFRMLFFGASICARVSRVTSFTQALNDYDVFAKLLFDEMFSRRDKYPLLGLYIWQHRLLEAIVSQKTEGIDSIDPNEVFTAMIDDCESNPGMTTLIARFIDVVLTEQGYNEPSDAGTTDEILWYTDVDGGDQDDTNGSLHDTDLGHPCDAEIDIYCEGVSILKDICFLRITPEIYDQLSQNCEFTRRMLTRKQLTQLKCIYRNFVLQKVQNTVIALKNADNDIVDTVASSADDVVRLVKGHLQGFASTVSVYSLCIGMCKHMPEDILVPFSTMVESNVLKVLARNDVKEHIRIGVTLLILGWDRVTPERKLALLKSCTVALNRDQLLLGVDIVLESGQEPLVQLVMHLLDASGKLIVEDIADGGTLINALLSKVEKQVPNLVEYLSHWDSNTNSHRNVDVITVATALWCIARIMATVDTKLKVIGSTDSTPDECNAISRESSGTVHHVIKLCEEAVNASSRITIQDRGLQAIFQSRCWSRYLQCAKWIEELQLLYPMLEINDIELTSDTVASRAYAQLGTGFISNLKH
ncbi:U3 small nnucleolar RNA-associated protein 6 family protein [Babesia bovis T2Bo]|uniref:U3 small nucleolar RNA-associated protein 6 N-terminal domain-containing protein n=1 Tax=Babesia bovis TaxID=5865 RepID=A7AN30_BABBO|nr:U3 small nnucleolar RNA-associated protein 6 family protein [Babesia bovis T2Bo]EDO07964.1 U3 small nnucleolar RNA-associated protein 6 family protein [Babesia bovis T2Bo]|eukprot:XP_001611532.1 hypothetical protein [Babesia bovis T2Bo]